MPLCQDSTPLKTDFYSRQNSFVTRLSKQSRGAQGDVAKGPLLIVRLDHPPKPRPMRLRSAANQLPADAAKWPAISRLIGGFGSSKLSRYPRDLYFQYFYSVQGYIPASMSRLHAVDPQMARLVIPLTFGHVCRLSLGFRNLESHLGIDWNLTGS